jgi:hypothetical protein
MEAEGASETSAHYENTISQKVVLLYSDCPVVCKNDCKGLLVTDLLMLMSVRGLRKTQNVNYRLVICINI